MKILYGSKEDWITEEWKLSIIDKNSGFFLHKILDNNLEQTSLNSVEIETVNRCNNNCSFCPVSVNNDKRKFKKMDEKLYFKIIDDLATMEYAGFLSLFSNNEPLLDNRLIQFVKYAVEKLPNAKHALYTNGLLLDKDKYKQLIELLDYLIIDNYNDNFELNEPIKEIMDINGLDGSCDVTVFMRKKNQILLNRGGLSPNKKNLSNYTSSCVLPFFQMVIRPDGKVSKCCQDAYGIYTLGDVSCNSVSEVWNSTLYKSIRRKMVNEGRSSVEGCSNCDLFGLKNYFQIQWKHSYVSIIVELIFSKIQEGYEIALVGDKLKMGKYIDFFDFNGIKMDILLDVIEKVEDNVFYIFIDYYWEQLLKFNDKSVGINYIIFERIDNFELSHKKTKRRDYIRVSDVLGKIIKSQSEDKLVIFGTGNNSNKMINKFSLNPVFFIDNDEKKQTKLFMGKMVYGINKLLEDEYLILVSPERDKEIIEQLIKCGISEQNIIQAKYLLEDF